MCTSAGNAVDAEMNRRLRWQLWIDGCAGYWLLEGSRWTLGGAAAAGTVEIALLADLPRRAGQIERDGDDFFWLPCDRERVLLRDTQDLPVGGSARMMFARPSRLCGSAVLRSMPPHRLADHVDGVLLFHQTLLIGPRGDCHVRCPHAESTLVLTRRGPRWLVKPTEGEAFVELMPRARTTIGNVAITLEDRS